jgi:hypothetical protein
MCNKLLPLPFIKYTPQRKIFAVVKFVDLKQKHISVLARYTFLYNIHTTSIRASCELEAILELNET